MILAYAFHLTLLGVPRVTRTGGKKWKRLKKHSNSTRVAQ